MSSRSAGVDPLQGLRDKPGRVRVDGQIRPVGDPEQADEVHRIALERVIPDDVDAIVVDLEILGVRDRAGLPTEASDEAAERRRRLGLPLLERRAHDRGQIADILGDEEIVLHEPLDVDQPRAGRIAQLPGDRPLNVEAQPLLRPAGEKVEPAAHAPEEFLASAKQRELARREQSGRHKLARVVNAVSVFGDPEQRVEVAQAPLALLDIGLDEIARRSRLPHPGFALSKLGGDKLGRRLGDDLLVEPGCQLLEQRLVARNEPGLEERGADGHVGARLLQAFVDSSRRVPDLELEVPEHIEQRLDHLLDAGRRLVGHEEQDIDVRKRREHAAPIAADRDDRRQRPSELSRGEPSRGHFEPDAQQFVGLGAQRLRAGASGSARLQSAAGFVPTGVQRRLQSLDGGAPERRRIARMLLMERSELVEKLGSLDALQRRRGGGAALDRRNLGV